MYCTKCGKEIPEGENKVCEECQKKLLKEIVSEEKNENVKKEEKKVEKKTTEEPKDKKKNNYVIVVCMVVIIIALLIAVLLDYTKNRDIGNTIGNIRNYGYAAISDEWIYFLSPNEDSSNVGIFKVRTDGTDKTELFMNTDDSEQEIVSINVAGNYVYFIGIVSDESNETDSVDNKVYRMRTDGSDKEVINDNEINNDCYEIYVINGYVYYIDTDANVARMNLDGSNKTVVSENGTGYLGLTDEYIIYNTLENEDSDDYVTYIMDINGDNPRPIIEGKRLYSVNIENGYVYYTNEEKQIYRTKIDSNEEELIYNTTAYNLNVNNGYAYFLNYLDAENQDYTVCIFKVELVPEAEGEKTAENLMELETYSSFLNIVGDWAIYMDSDDTSGFINMVKIDGSGETKQLYYLDYEEYYNSLEQVTEEDSDTEANTTETNTVETTNTAENVVATNTVENTSAAQNVTSTNTVENNEVTENVTESNTVENTNTTNTVENNV